MRKLNCLRCNAPMEFASNEKIQLGETGWLLGDLPNLFAGSMEVDIYVCTKCKRLEFFSSNEESEDNSLPQRTCPNCGDTHDFDYPKCPACGHKYF